MSKLFNLKDNIKPKKRICLCLDGGGCRGVIESTILKHFELEPDLIAGTSTGTIVGALYALGYSPSQITNLYINKVSNIFTPNYLSIFGLFGPKYKPNKLRRLLKSHFGNYQFSSDINNKYSIVNYKYFTNKQIIRLMFTTYNLSERKVDFFKSYGSSKFQSTPVCNILQAATAAPTYFPPISIDDTLYCDGGIVANCPLLAAYTEMRKLFPNDEILILSIGTGYSTSNNQFAHSKHFGMLKWIYNLVNVFVDNQYDPYIMDRITRKVDDKCTVIRLNPPIPDYLNKMILTPPEMQELINIVQDFMHSNSKRISYIIDAFLTE